MTDTMEKFNSATSALQQKSGAGFRRGMNQVFNLAAALQARGVNVGNGIENI